MADTILKHGDKVLWDAPFGPAIVFVKPGKLKGSGKSTLNKKKICVQGDEKKVKVQCGYMTPAFPIPGKGVLTILKLAPNQTTRKAKSGGKAILLKGAAFQAQYEVKKPAQLITPQGPKKDPVKKYVGTGKFVSTNRKVKGT
ncbi:MAG: hypothetical protein AAF570_17680 [Bacteroidota bacterium]